MSKLSTTSARSPWAPPAGPRAFISNATPPCSFPHPEELRLAFFVREAWPRLATGHHHRWHPQPRRQPHDHHRTRRRSHLVWRRDREWPHPRRLGADINIRVADQPST